ncbi:MAG: hypothetical protein HGA19_00585 [Oscillochloris sp.]|nr:hypothetical protein [Oscillochloris sp.]
MASVSLRGIFCSEWVFIPQNEASLYTELRSIVPSRLHVRVIGESVEKSTLSIRHKLTVMMYQAALISKLKAEEFADFEEKDRYNTLPLGPSIVNHYGYSVQMNNIHEYRLYLALFLETFAATAFSLLDVTGHLLNELYILGKTPEDISFHSVRTALTTKSIYPFLTQYAPGNPTSVSWIKPLKEIRNRTTHRPITDVCEAETRRRASIFKSMPEARGFFYLDPNLFGGTDILLSDFVCQVFSGLEEFVEDLYDHLRQAIILAQSTKGSLPID